MRRRAFYLKQFRSGDIPAMFCRQNVVYALCEPDTEEVRYIGCTNNIRLRFGEHSRIRGKGYCQNWLRKLARSDKSPLFRVFCCVQTPEEARRVEVALIASFKSRGARLTNMTDGGEGTVGYVKSEETKRKMSLLLKGRPKSQETKDKLSALAKDRLSSPSERDKYSRASKAYYQKNPQARARLQEQSTKIWQDEELRSRKSEETKKRFAENPEAREVIAESNRKRRGEKRPSRSVEHAAKIAAALRGKKHSVETCAKISAAHIGNKYHLGVLHSPETKAKMSASHLKRRQETASIYD
jgi:hypothetical protein